MNGSLTVDPRVIAESLQLDTYDLAEMFTKWCGETLMSVPDFETTSQRGPTSLDQFDERIAKARRHLEAAHAAFDAWQEDNPEDEETGS